MVAQDVLGLRILGCVTDCDVRVKISAWCEIRSPQVLVTVFSSVLVDPLVRKEFSKFLLPLWQIILLIR